MRRVPALAIASVAVLCTFCTLCARPASAQSGAPALSPFELAVACAPPPALALPEGRTLHVAGAQDTVRRSVYGPHDLLILDGGTQSGVQLGQQFFVRRPTYAGTSDHSRPLAILTLGWIRIIAANDATAIASVDHFCGAIYQDDYLEPYAAPSLPAGLDKEDLSGTLDFTAMGRVISGVDSHATGGPREFFMLDHGSDQGLKVGSRFAVYRDVKEKGLPLASVAEGVVVSASGSMSIARLTRSRDAVIAGDYVVPRK
jgi:hypothetical protein